VVVLAVVKLMTNMEVRMKRKNTKLKL